MSDWSEGTNNDSLADAIQAYQEMLEQAMSNKPPAVVISAETWRRFSNFCLENGLTADVGTFWDWHLSGHPPAEVDMKGQHD